MACILFSFSLHRNRILARVAFALCLLSVNAAFALPPLLSSYSHTAWGPQHGAPNDVLNFAQSNDGWLWIASPNGLFRFDGVRFERMDSVQGQPLHSTNVMGLLASTDGSLWVGHRFGGISHFKNGQVHLHKPGDGLPAGDVYSIVPGPDGALWAATTQGLGHLGPGADRFTTVAPATGLPSGGIYKVMFDRAGRQWVATLTGVFHRAPGEQQYHRAWPQHRMVALAQAPDGTVWGADETRMHYRLREMAPPDNARAEAVAGGADLHIDRAGTMWVLKLDAVERRTAPYLALPRSEAASQQVGQNTGISGPLPQAWYQDREGNIWVGTSSGIDRLRPNRVHTLPVKDVLDHPGVIADAGDGVLVGDIQGVLRSAGSEGTRKEVGRITLTAGYRAPDGAIWIGDLNARWLRQPDGSWQRYPHPARLHGYATHAMLQNRDGSMWVAMQTFGLFRVEGTEWQANGNLQGMPASAARALAAGASGQVWVGHRDGLISRIDGKRIRIFGPADGINIGPVQILFADGARIWAGGEQGVRCFDNGRWLAVNAPLRGIAGMARTADGELWLHGSEGITRITAAEVARLLREPDAPVAYERFDALDGLRGSAEQIRPLPTLTQALDGRLWFASASHVASMDPRHIPRNPLPPPVEILALHANGKTLAGPALKLPTGTSQLQFDYTALSLSMPERVRFRYRLHGVDSDWREAGQRREAYYTNLAPGSYRFEVTAANEDGLWNTAGARMTVTIPPRFVQTGWFIALLAGLAAAALYWLYRLRVQRLTRRMDDLMHARLAERARIARGLHDTLLQSVQGLIMFFNQQSRRQRQDAEERRKIDQTLELADQLMHESRDYIADLRAVGTPQELGAALQDYGQVMLQERLAVSIVGRPHALTALVRDELNVIGREALFNCARHANATEVTLMLEYGPDQLRLLVRDNGCGTAADREGHYGLACMRERAQAIGALYRFSSRPADGTVVDVVIDAALAYAVHRPEPWLTRLRRRWSRSGTA
ncbi:sensor histidine kinase [Massilia sp. CF038]|uniref:sensor histidine kinase n=1 Tax=Massilia sp. CF038 TaxID=1881045 RepID=UPI00092148BF|nr:sensor histidine kinase [Massilia sp. CF038]SHH09638.1 Signal transduction histidine kinase [Massilia sp. CF038]